MKTKITHLAVLGALAVGLAGCAAIPAGQPALAMRNVADELPPSIKLAREGWPEARWWTAYGDHQLNALIEQALAKGPTLEAAAAQIASARSAVNRANAELGLETGLNAGISRQRYSANGLMPPPTGGSWVTEGTVDVAARYHFDWWGRNKAQIAAAVGEVNARRASYAAAEQDLSAAIAAHYFALQGLWARRANGEQMVLKQNASIEDRKKRLAHGLATADDLRIAEAGLLMLKKQIDQFDTEAAQEQEALRALLGADSHALASLKPQALMPAPHRLPARLGFELLARRPDLQAARWRVQSAMSRIDAAQAAFYPDLNLSASFGLDAVSIPKLLRAGSATALIGPALSLPLFDSKRLSAQLDSSRSERNEFIAEYNLAVVNAVRDVAQDGAALQGIERQLAQQAAVNASAAAVARSTERKLQQGLSDNNTLLTSQLALLQLQDLSLHLQQLQLQAEVALTHSLGGGYLAETPALTSR
jgi:multidrug efflux system outer membrane protein